ncbi:MAG: hypothetical protein EDM75_08050, partial [Chlorobiota bacterium]
MSAKVARSLILFLFVLCPVIPAQKVTANKGVDPAFVSGQMNKAESYFKTGETDKGAVVLDSLREYLIRKFAFTRAIEVSRITLSLNEKIRNKK